MPYQNIGSAKIVRVTNITGLRALQPKDQPEGATSKISGRVALTGDIDGVKQTVYPTIFLGDKQAFIDAVKAGEAELSLQQQFNDETGQQSVSANFNAPESVNLDMLESTLL